MSLIAELKRRKVFKVGGAYLVVAWLAVQAASIGFPAFDAPPWALRVFILAALLGFPVALVLAWAFESTSGGVVLERPTRGNHLVFAAAGVLVVLALGWYFYGQPAFRTADSRGAVSKPVQPPAASSATSAPAQAAPNTIAVLAFANMSSDAENEYFADGISEELLNVLARIESLKVASRTSAFAFKGKNLPVGEIARALKVAHVLEGSVRKQGGKVRITAQLIDAASDQHLWSETYDRDLTDIFAVQQEIAQSISKELGRVLGRGGALADVRVEQRTTDLTAYQAYLSGRELFHRRSSGLADARRMLEDAVQRDPNFADAWAVLAGVHAVSPSYLQVSRDESMQRAQDAAQKARGIDDTLALPYAVLARVDFYRGRMLESESQFAQAIARDPKDSTSFLWRALLYSRVGDFDKAVADMRMAVQLEPYLGINHGWLGITSGLSGDRNTGDSELRRGAELGWSSAPYYQALFSLGDGNAALAAEQLTAYFTQRQTPREYSDAVIAAVLDPAKRQALLAISNTISRNVDGIGTTSTLAALGLHHEAVERAVESSAAREDVSVVGRWYPSARGMMADPRYLELAEREGLMSWWRARGFPTGCTVAESTPRHLDCSERWKTTDALSRGPRSGLSESPTKGTQ